MPSPIVTYAQVITQPLQGLHNHFSQLAAHQGYANDQLRLHANDLLSVFKGDGATAFADFVSYYLHISERHVQVLGEVANAVYICYFDIIDATYTVSRADLHDGLVDKVLTNVSLNAIIQNGRDAVQTAINDMLSTLNDTKTIEGDFFGRIFPVNLGEAFGDLWSESNDAEHLIDNLTSLLQDIGMVLGRWASTICDTVRKLLRFVSSALWDIADFNCDFAESTDNRKTDFDPNASFLLVRNAAQTPPTPEQRALAKANRDYFNTYGVKNGNVDINLRSSEGKGGHTLKRHVFITDAKAEKAVRPGGEKYGQAYGTFLDANTAQAGVYEAILGGQAVQDKKNPWNMLYKSVDIGHPVGHVHIYDAKANVVKKQEISKVTVVITTLGDCYILSAFPSL